MLLLVLDLFDFLRVEFPSQYNDVAKAGEEVEELTLSVRPFSAARAILSLLRGAMSAMCGGQLKRSRDEPKWLATGFAAFSACKSQNGQDPPKKFWSGLILSVLSWGRPSRHPGGRCTGFQVQIQY